MLMSALYELVTRDFEEAQDIEVPATCSGRCGRVSRASAVEQVLRKQAGGVGFLRPVAGRMLPLGGPPVARLPLTPVVGRPQALLGLSKRNQLKIWCSSQVNPVRTPSHR